MTYWQKCLTCDHADISYRSTGGADLFCNSLEEHFENYVGKVATCGAWIQKKVRCRDCRYFDFEKCNDPSLHSPMRIYASAEGNCHSYVAKHDPAHCDRFCLHFDGVNYCDRKKRKITPGDVCSFIPFKVPERCVQCSHLFARHVNKGEEFCNFHNSFLTNMEPPPDKCCNYFSKEASDRFAGIATKQPGVVDLIKQTNEDTPKDAFETGREVLKDMVEAGKEALQNSGRKFDAGKQRWDLIPIEAIAEIVKRYTHGAEKYAPNNWQKVDNFEDRYYGALMRHLSAWRQGEKIDEESGLTHLSAVGWNALALIWKDLQE